MNWGKKLVLGLVLFMVFISILGTIIIMRSGNDALVENDYYEKGQTYDQEYNARKNAINDLVVPVISTDEHRAIITFPVPVDYKLTCKRPSDSNMDRIFQGKTDADGRISLSKSELQSGPWLLNIEFIAKGKKYLFEGQIMMP